MLSRTYLFTVLMIGAGLGALAQIDQNQVDDIAKQIGAQVPGGLPVNASDVAPALEQAQEVFRKKCEKNADDIAFNKSVTAKEDLVKCVQNIINMEQLKSEMEEARPKGELDEVFKKYCEKTPQVKQCFRNFTSGIETCLDNKERGNLKTVHNITEQLAEFICHKEGDRIALFIAEHGPECLMEQQEAINNCTTTRLGAAFNPGNLELDNLPELVFEKRECARMWTLQECVVGRLQLCSEPTPANIAESLFKFVRQATPCKDHEPKPKADTRSSAPARATALAAAATVAINLLAALV